MSGIILVLFTRVRMSAHMCEHVSMPDLQPQQLTCWSRYKQIFP